MDVLSLLKDDKKAQDFLSKSEKTKSEIAQGLRENEKKIEELKELSASVKLERERLSLLKDQAEKALKEAKEIDQDIKSKQDHAAELLANARVIESSSKQAAESMLKGIKATEDELEVLRFKMKQELDAAQALKASWANKITKLKQIISEA